MKRICLLLCLLLAFGSIPALATAEIAYQLPKSAGIIHWLHVDPSGDLVYHAWMDALDIFDYDTDGMFIRSTPEGEVVWAYGFPYVSELGSGAPTILDNGDYVKPEFAEDWHSTLYYFDRDEGFVWQSEPIRGYSALPGEDCILFVDAMPPDVLRVHWIDYEGSEIKALDYDLEHFEDTVPWVVASEGGMLYYSSLWNDEFRYKVAKIQADGEVAWKNTFPLPKGYMSDFLSDSMGGFYLVTGPVAESYENYVTRVDREGKTVWEKELAVDEMLLACTAATDAGLHMVFVQDDMLRYITMDAQGNETSGPARSISSVLDMKKDPNISGLFFAAEGKPFVYGTQATVANSMHTLLPFVYAIDDFPVLP